MELSSDWAAGGDGDCGVCGKALVISMGQWQKLYGSAHWRRRAKAQLRAEPLCRLCAANGKVTPAQVADHIQRHEGDVNSFYLGELQSLCWDCHERVKKGIEHRGFDITIGADGWPVHPNHPVYGRKVRQPSKITGGLGAVEAPRFGGGAKHANGHDNRSRHRQIGFSNPRS
jgi:5-methylcytosine-specific restriction protein A